MNVCAVVMVASWMSTTGMEPSLTVLCKPDMETCQRDYRAYMSERPLTPVAKRCFEVPQADTAAP